MNPINNNAVIYARYSSNSQDAQTIEMQIERCKEYAKNEKFNILKVYTDEAKSGRNGTRPGLIQLKEDCKLGEFYFVIVYMSDRLYRNAKEALELEEELKKYNVEILYTYEKFDDSPIGKYMKVIQYATNQFYSDQYAARIKDGLARNAREFKTRGSNVPFGYKTDNKHIVIDDNTSCYVVKIFDMFLSGYTFTEICEYLNSLGIKTKRNRTFNICSIRRILSNEMYIGTYKYKDNITEDVIENIIDKEKFYKAKEILTTLSKKRAKPKRENYALTGKLYCSICNDTMKSDSGTSQTGVVHRYYRCKKKNNCSQKPVKKDYIEKKVLNTISSLLDDNILDEVSKRIEKKSKEVHDNTTLNQLIKSKEINSKKKSNIIKAISETEVKEAREELINELEKLKNNEEVIEESIIREKNNHILLSYDQVRFFLEENIKNLNSKYRDRIINLLVNKIYYNDGKVYIIYNCCNREKKIGIDDVNAIINQQGSPDYPNAPPNENQANPAIYYGEGFFLMAIDL